MKTDVVQTLVNKENWLLIGKKIVVVMLGGRVERVACSQNPVYCQELLKALK